MPSDVEGNTAGPAGRAEGFRQPILPQPPGAVQQTSRNKARKGLPRGAVLGHRHPWVRPAFPGQWPRLLPEPLEDP